MLSNHRPKVLCVDDDEDSRVMLKALLSLARIEAITVGTAAHALSMMRAERFDLCVMDAWLPGVDGFELCRQIRAIKPYVPVLFFSGAAYEADKKRGIAAGAIAYVVKPDIAGLLRSVLQLVAFAVRPANRQVIPLRRKVKSISPPFMQKTPQPLYAGWKR
jgi:two-component system, OmpR family, phosphate regulon response regulator PhoB